MGFVTTVFGVVANVWVNAVAAVYGGLFLAVLASFWCVVGERGLRGEGLWGRSHCACGRTLHWWENVPVLGWWRVHGVASCCGAAIPRVYVASELVSVVLGAGVGFVAVLLPPLWAVVLVAEVVFIQAVGIVSWTRAAARNRSHDESI